MVETLASRFALDDGARSEILLRSRQCAALTKPWVLPPESQTSNQSLPETFQSVGATGVTAMESRLLLSIYPPDRPFFTLALPASIEYAQDVAPEYKQALKDKLFLIELAVQAVLESAALMPKSNKQVMGFRNAKRASISHCLITGESLERINPDFTISIIRRDNYVSRRDSSGNVVYHIIREMVDPAGLSDDVLAKSELKREDFENLPHERREKAMYTICQWQPATLRWIVRQELNDRAITENEYVRSPYNCTTYELTPPEHYGRGWIEMNFGELRSLNELNARMLDYAGIASKLLWVKDASSRVRAEDLAKPNGSMFVARVLGGQVQDVAMLRAEKMQDFSVVANMIGTMRQNLGKALGLETDATPRGDRVTAFQAARVGAEVEMTQGGPYAAIAEENQLPMLRYMLHEMQVQNLIPVLPDNSIEIRTLTGLSALERNSQLEKVLSLAQTLSQFGPEMLGRINLDILAGVIARYGGVYEDGLIKSPRQVQQEQQAAMQQQAAMAATQKGIDVMGNAAEQALMPQPQ